VWNQFGQFGVSGDREWFWRDTQGIHAAWHPRRIDGVLATTVVSSFEPTSGAWLGNTFLDMLGARFAVGATGMGPDETVALAGAAEGDQPNDPWWTAVVLYRADTQQAKLVKLDATGDTSAVVGVGWDGQAFAAHFFESGVLKVARVSKEGDVLLAPTAFGQAGGPFDWLRMATDAESGVSVSLSTSGGIWVTGHQRDGTPLPDPTKVGGTLVQPQGEPEGAGWVNASDHADLGVYGGGFLLVWSANWASVSTVVQPLGADLQTTANAIPIPGTGLAPDFYEAYEASAIWGTAAEFWLYGFNKYVGLKEIHVVGGQAQKRVMMAHDPGIGQNFDGREPSVVTWKGERWLGYVDEVSATIPLRIVRARDDCTYPEKNDP
jgi:hypothetical protein